MSTNKLLRVTLVLLSLSMTPFSQETLAEQKSSSNGTITYVEDKGKEQIVDPENPEGIIDPLDGFKNEKEGALRIDFMSNLRILDAPITMGVGEYYANPTKVQPLKESQNGLTKYGSEEERGNFIQVTDKRAVRNGKSSGWNLSAKLTKQFHSTAGTLNGATIDFATPHVSSTSSTEQVVAKSFKLAGDGSGGENVLKVAPEYGWGTYTVQYGRPKDESMKKGVKLTVPARTPVEATKYTAEITWTIAELPTT